MRIFEIVSGNDKAAKATQRRVKAAKATQRRVKANRKIADAQHRRSEASRKYQADISSAGADPDKRRDASARYQDTLRRAAGSANDAMAKLRDTRK